MAGRSILDHVAAQAAKEEAIDRVEVGADDRWMRFTTTLIHFLAERYLTFTTDLVWEFLDQHAMSEIREPRAMGAAMRTAKEEGWIRPLDEFTPSGRVSRHGAPIRVWQSECWSHNPTTTVDDLWD